MTGRQLIKSLMLVTAGLFFSFPSKALDKPLSPPAELPVKVDMSLLVNKVFNINSIDESYQVDAYMELSWIDERLKFDSIDSQCLVFENAKADEIIGNDIWFPAFEMINIQGDRDIKNKSIEINSNGGVLYSERFYGTFSCDMDYRKFPFDTQAFKIFLETFSYDESTLVFVDPKLFPIKEDSERLFDKWTPIELSTKVTSIHYEENNSGNYQEKAYSRANFEIKAKRLSGYFVWQVLFPLFLIIIASFMMFWIKDFGTQIGTGFTLMLTVVAFNFFSSSILPELPYNTFIESTIIVGYTLIFFNIIAVLIMSKLKSKLKKRLTKMFRITFPLIYMGVMIMLCFKFYQ